MEDHKNRDIPKHIVDVSKQDKRRQRRTFRQVISRAGFPNARDSLSCIEPIDKAKVATSEDNQKPTDYRLSHRESQSANANSKDNSRVPYLGPASRSLIASIQSSRTSDIFGSSTQPISHNNNVPQLKAKRDDVNIHRQSDRIHSINTSLAASGHLFKTTISDGFGKLMYPNGTVYLGELENDTPHGHGKALYVGGASYEGDWNKGNREGVGKLSFSDGSYYEGTFLNKFHGDGKFVSPALGINYSGMFSAGNVYGEYTVKFKDGERFSRRWPDARLSLHEAVDKLVKGRRNKA